MLVSMLFDDEDESCITAVYQVQDHVMTIKQRPDEGRFLDKEKEAAQEQAMDAMDGAGRLDTAADEPVAAAPTAAAGATAAAAAAAAATVATGEYDSAFPNVGLVVWQAGFVLAEWLVRTRPLGPWAGQRVVDLGCGVGQLGIGLALAGAAVTLTDLPHIVPLTQTNIDLNAGHCAIRPVCQPYMWGAPISGIAQAGADALQQPQQQQQQPQQPQRWDAIVAADVLYEPQWYDALLAALVQLCPAPGQPSASPPAYLCYRLRKYREGSFEARARGAGFEVSEVPVGELHADYRCGGYRLIRLQRRQQA